MSEHYMETEDPYIQKVIDAGGWASYRHRHLDRLALMLTPKPDGGRRRSRRRLSPLRRLPPEILRRVVEYWAHVMGNGEMHRPVLHVRQGRVVAFRVPNFRRR